MKVLSPMPTGNGAHILHRQLQQRIPGYQVRSYSPWWTLVPPLLPWFAMGRNVDLIHAALDYGCFNKRPGIPLVLTIHNYVLDDFMVPYSSGLQRLHYKTDLRAFTRLSLALADQVTAVSAFVARRLQEDLRLSTDIRVIYNGIDEHRFTPVKSDLRSARPFRILFSGNLSKRKRADLILPLSKALGSGFEIWYTAGLAGNKTLEGSITDGAGLVPLGQVPHAKIHEVYQSVDALFMPSVREGFGLAVAEAMACGLPVVANNCSALPELVEHLRGGFLCEIGEVAQYADAFRRLADDAALAREMGQFNRARVEERFSLTRMVAEYRALFESMLDKERAVRHEQ